MTLADCIPCLSISDGFIIDEKEIVSVHSQSSCYLFKSLGKWTPSSAPFPLYRMDLRRTRLFFFQQQFDTCLLWPFVSGSASTPRWHYFIRSKQRLPLNPLPRAVLPEISWFSWLFENVAGETTMPRGSSSFSGWGLINPRLDKNCWLSW